MNLCRLPSILLIIISLTLPSLAGKADMEKEAVKYIRSLLREVPELAGTKNTRAARESLLSDYKRHDILALSAAMRETIEGRDNPVPEKDYNDAITKLKDAARQTKETKFLLEKATAKKVDAELRLLLFRLMEHHIDTDQDIRKNTLTELLTASRAYKAQHNKYAPTLADLSLNPEIAKFTDNKGAQHDWLYLGGTKKGINRKSSRLIFVEPVADSYGEALSINSRGSKTPVNLAEVKSEMQALAKELAAKPKPTPKPSKPEINEYSPILKKQLKDVLIAHLAYTVKNKRNPSKIEDLNLPPHLVKSTSPDNKTTADWILIPPNKTISAGKAQVILASPFKHDGKNYLIATNDGKISALSPADHKKILAGLNQ